MVESMSYFHFDRIGICRGCSLGKNSKKYFLNSNRRSKEILRLVHSDLHGPMSALSMNGCLYYVIFTDDFYHKILFYFLNTKKETFSKFQDFKDLVEEKTRK